MLFSHSPSDFVLARSDEHGHSESEKSDRAEKTAVAGDEAHGSVGLVAGRTAGAGAATGALGSLLCEW